MASPGNQHCASCIEGVMFSTCLSVCPPRLKMIPLYLVECRLAKVALLPSKSEFLFYKLFCCLTGSYENCKDDLLLKMAFGILHCGDILKVRWAILYILMSNFF